MCWGLACADPDLLVSAQRPTQNDAMRYKVAALALTAIALGGCSTTHGTGNLKGIQPGKVTGDAVRLYASRPEILSPRSGNPPGVAPMPFGRHPFGPWSVPGDATSPLGPRFAVRNPPGLVDEATVDPNEPIVVDFVKKDQHTVLHYLALRLGLQVIAEDLSDLMWAKVPSHLSADELVRYLQDRFQLRCVLEGDVLIVKRAASVRVSGQVHPQADSRFNGEFTESDAVAAIMETAKVARVQVFVPNAAGAETPISFRLQNSSADTILRKIAELAGLRVEVVDGAYLFHPAPARKD